VPSAKPETSGDLLAHPEWRASGLRRTTRPGRVTSRRSRHACRPGRATLYANEGVASANLKAACDDARRAYNALPARLELLFGDRQAFIDSFFRKLEKPAKVATDGKL